MAAPKLKFTEKEKEKREERKEQGPSQRREAARRSSTPPPPRRISSPRDPKKHNIFSNLWAGIESIPRGAIEQEEMFRHAIAKDIANVQGLAGAVAYAPRLAIQASLLGLPGGSGEAEKLRRIAKAPWANREKRSALSDVAEPWLRDTWESVRAGTGAGGWRDFKEIWHDNPMAAIGGVTILGAPVTRVAGIGRMAKTIKTENKMPGKDGKSRSLTNAEALKLATVESYYPGMLDKLGINGSPFAPRTSGRRTSRSTYGRAGQKAFDWASEKIDEGAVKGLGPSTPLSKTRRDAAGKRRADDLNRGRLVTNAMRHVSTFADYLNDGMAARVGTALGRRKDALASRDAAVGAALHASSQVDPVEAVRLAADDTKRILQSGRRSAHNGDIGDLEPEQRVGQTVYVTHGIDEEGTPIREKSVVIADLGDRVTVGTPSQFGSGQDIKTIPHGRAHLLDSFGEGEIPLSADEIRMLERRYDLLTNAHAELVGSPQLEAKFRASVQSMADLGQLNEQLGIDYFTRGMEPTGAESMAIRQRLTERRNQFLDRLGGEGVDAIDFGEGLWLQLRTAMENSGRYTDQQYRIFLTILERQARLWAMEGDMPTPPALAEALATAEFDLTGKRPTDFDSQFDYERFIQETYLDLTLRDPYTGRSSISFGAERPFPNAPWWDKRKEGGKDERPAGQEIIDKLNKVTEAREAIRAATDGPHWLHNFHNDPVKHRAAWELARQPNGRRPQDYLSSPEGMNIGGIDFSKPEDLEATMNAMFQTAGERHGLVKKTTTVLIQGEPKIGDLVSTPRGMGHVRSIVEENEAGDAEAGVDMLEGANLHLVFDVEDLRLSPTPWIGHPQVHDYVMTPDGPAVVYVIEEGPAPHHLVTYEVEMIEFDGPSGMAIPAGRQRYSTGDVQRIADPRDEGKVFHLASMEALGQPSFPKKASSSQYRAAFEKAGVKSEEFYWMGLSMRPLLEDSLAAAQAELRALEKKLAEDPQHDYVYGTDERLEADMKIDAAEKRLYAYQDEPDPAMILDANWGEKSFPVQAVQDRVDAAANFVDIKETLYSSHNAPIEFRDRWGPGRNGEDSGLIIRDPTAAEPYHELVLSLPNSELFRGGGGHFPRRGTEDPVIHIRFHEVVDTNGNRIILIDELQSDWNNRVRSSGVREILTPHDKRQVTRLRDKEARVSEISEKLASDLGFSETDITHWHDRLVREKNQEMNDAITERNEARRTARKERGESPYPSPEDPDEPAIFGHGRDKDQVEEALAEEHADDPIFNELLELRNRFNGLKTRRHKYREAADAIETGGGSSAAVERGPWSMGDAAKYLAFKRLIRWAADHDQTAIVWTRAHEQGIRYMKFDDLPVDEGDPVYPDLDPADYGDEFNYSTGDTTIDHGGAWYRRDITPERLHELQQSPPVEVKWDDMADDDIGDQYVLLPPKLEEHDTYGTVAAEHPRHARIVSNMGETVVAQPIDPLWDPASIDISFRSDMGDSSYGQMEVSITNRIGENIFNETWHTTAREKGDVLFQVREKWERTLRNWSDDAENIEQNIDRMKEAVRILEDSPHFTNEWDYLFDNLDTEFDEWAWNEYVANQEPDEDSTRGARGDFQEIHDHEAYSHRRLRNLRADLKRLEEEKAAQPFGPHVTDFDTDIEALRLSIESARDKSNYANFGHTQGYDVMLPLMAERMLKPFRKEDDYQKVAIQKRVYAGRYGSEPQGVISDWGELDAWVMYLPEKMRKNAKDSQALFQKGNDIIKGASTWVGGPDGQRFIALTEHADVSTLMHEFIGHATEEMKRRYPELWEAVERDMGLPLDKWKTTHHEKFAKWVERYWMEGKAPSPELLTVMAMVKEWMKGVYHSITQLGKPMPDSTRILLNRHLGQGISARPGARAYVPHVSQFDTLMDTAPGGTRLAAGGNVIGKTQVDRRNFGARRNRGILWQSGELALSARPIIDQYFRRTKFMETEAVRQELYDEGHAMPKNGRPPEGAWMIRNPQAGIEKLSARNKSKLSEDDFARMIGEGDTPEEFVTKMEDIRKDHYAAPGEHPEWANDLENVRWVEGAKANARIQNVFPTAPRGRVAATAGSFNSMARLAGIYLRPLHYLVGNIPQNIMLVALTNPSALINSAKYGAYSFLPRVIREMGVGPRDLFAHDRHLYNRIKTETGDIQAGAGLPDFYTTANNNFQKTERRLNKISQGTAEKLGEVADQPYRVSVWIAHAKKYGYNTPDEWRKLLDSERGTPEARIRDDIAQQTREDMIDFNTLSPGERQNISRFFYLWAFTRGFAKWPITYAREYPGRAGLAATLADPSETDDNGIPLAWLPATGTMKTNKGRGKIRDLGFLDPTQGLRQQMETGIQAAHGNFQGLGGMLFPPLETGLQAITGGPRAPKGGLQGFADQIARDTVPFYDITRKTLAPGLDVRERVWRFLDADRFSIKSELGKGKNAEKKRKEDDKILRVLSEAGATDVLEQVRYSQDAYWHHKYMEQQIRFGSQAARKGDTLTNQEKLVILYATAADYFPQAQLPPMSQILAAPAEEQEKWRTELRDAMFGARNEVMNG